MSDVAAYHVFVCTLFPVQGGMWTAVQVYRLLKPRESFSVYQEIKYGNSDLNLSPI
jgi:hypothetical protein